MKCVFGFSLQPLPETFLILRRSERHTVIQYISLRVHYPAFFCQILMKLELSREIFEKYSNVKFHENPSSSSRVLPCRQTEDGQTNMMKLIVAYCNLANAPQRVSNTSLQSKVRHILCSEHCLCKT